jgi:hypothetical protein
VKPIVKASLQVAAVVAVVIAIIFILAAAFGDDEPEGIPTPPPGHHYCTDGNQLGFCPDNPPHEWR